MENWQDTEGLAFVIWFIVLFFISLIILIVFIIKTSFKSVLQKEKEISKEKLEHQKELLKTTIFTQEKERNRIAQDIHDGLVSELNNIRLSKKDNEQVINAKLQNCIKTVRLISHDLMPPLIEETSVEDLLTDIIEGLETNLKVEKHKLIHNNVKIDNSMKLQLVRIVQEVTTNILKHAEAFQINFLLRITKSSLMLKIEDNGIGFKEDTTTGLGLKNIIARTQLLNATHKFKSIKNKKTSFLLRLNLN